ncbi:MAG: hypothetical protein ACT4QD_19380 [Acidobacteriota bacterium]
MMRLFICVAVMLATAVLAEASQSLVEVARKEEARRKEVKQPGRVYTNEDLRGDSSRAGAPSPGTPSPGSPQPQAPDSPGTAAATPEAAAAGATPAAPELPPEKTQAYWADRMKAARSAVDRSRMFAEALQSRINALTTDFINRDDPAQRSQIELERQRTVAELERVKKEVTDQTKAIADIEEEARKAGIPPGWIR